MIRRSGKELVRAFKKLGAKEISMNGSHVKMEYKGIRFIIPVHSNKVLKKGTIAAIIKQSGVDVKLLADKL